MAYLFPAKPPWCTEDGCRNRGTYNVRSSLMQRGDADLAPRCSKHAKTLYAQYEAREAATAAQQQGGSETEV